MATPTELVTLFVDLWEQDDGFTEAVNTYFTDETVWENHGLLTTTGKEQALGFYHEFSKATGMTEGDDGLFTLAVQLAAGDYEFKVALDGAWTTNYGSDGEQDGPNYTFSMPADGSVTFTYDPETHLVDIAIQ